MYFVLKSFAQQEKLISAYYFDNIVEFLAGIKNASFGDDFRDKFFIPLNLIFRKKFEEIRDSGAQEAVAGFSIQIPFEIIQAAQSGFSWYANEYPAGEFIQIANDFLAIIKKASAKQEPLFITAE